MRPARISRRAALMLKKFNFVKEIFGDQKIEKKGVVVGYRKTDLIVTKYDEVIFRILLV
jgi:hypothetical protein